MKTGRKIFIIYVGLVVLLMLIAAIDWRVNSDPKQWDTRFNTIKTTLPAFSHLKIKNQPNLIFTCSDSDSTFLNIVYKDKQKDIPTARFKMCGDTLMLDSVINKANVNMIELFYNSNLKSVTVSESNINFRVSDMSYLNWVLDNSNVYFAEENGTKTINKLYVNAINHSNFHLNWTKVDSLVIQANSSNFYLNSEVFNISGFIKNSSNMTMYNSKGDLDILLHKDKTSRINLN